MYRVELKVFPLQVVAPLEILVPNVPCGVESLGRSGGCLWHLLVPNVPCGVEREAKINRDFRSYLFLMYRVELKGLAPKSSL